MTAITTCKIQKIGLIASVCALSLPNTVMAEPTGKHSSETTQWYTAGKAAVTERLKQQPNTKRAKNVILFVGDGMSVATLTAARILEGQIKGSTGEENALSFERFPYSALVKTYNTDRQVADSAGTATALNTGVKTRIGVVNTAPHVINGTCDLAENARLMPLAHLAEKSGLSTGAVSTARLTHATPAAVFAQASSRGWEDDSNMSDEIKAAGCTDIAQQILGNLGGDGLDVALGGGRRHFLPKSEDGRREDNRNIITEWQTQTSGTYVHNAAGLSDVDTSKTTKLLGLFSKSHMSFEAKRSDDEPSLKTMTEKAIEVLSNNQKGYYLMVEAGRIDHAHHAGIANLALNDAVELSQAVERAVQMVDLEETLILVTSDHSHVFVMQGYPSRGNAIMGLVDSYEKPGELELGTDGKPMTTLGYYNGPGAIQGSREDLTNVDVTADNFMQQAAIPKHSETHGGDDVALYAIGPWAHLARGNMEQNVIFHIMFHAFGFGEE